MDRQVLDAKGFAEFAMAFELTNGKAVKTRAEGFLIGAGAVLWLRAYRLRALYRSYSAGD